jgi:hypothetical protein
MFFCTVSVPPREAALDGPGGYARGFFLDTAEVAKELLCPLCTHVLRKPTAIQGDPGGLVYCESCLLHRFFNGPAPVLVPPRAAPAAALPPPDQAAGHAGKGALTSPTRSLRSSAAGATMRGSGTGGGGTAKATAPAAAAPAPTPLVAVHTARTPADLKPILLFQRKVQRLRVACHIAPHRCWSIGVMGADESFWRSHDLVCAYAADACAACGTAMERGLLAAHAQFECSLRFVTCAACGVGGGTLRACDMDAHRKVCARQAQIEALGTQLLATAAFHHMLDGDTRTVASVVTQSAAVRLVDAERTLTALRALAVEYRAEIEEYGRRLHAAIVARQRTVDAWRDAGRREEEVIEVW